MCPANQSAFGNQLRDFREAAGLSQEDLALRAGLSVRGVSDLERGQRKTPRLETVRMLADGLGLDDDERSKLLAARGRTVDDIAMLARRVPDGIPQPPTSFIGREAEIGTVIRLLNEPDTRFVTLVGPGGVGKTRIAIEVAHERLSKAVGSVVFVDLTSILEPRLVLPTIARQLNVVPLRDADMEALLISALQQQAMLLVLDNLEQVSEAATELAFLLRECPLLTILATSRVVLHIAAEHVIPIEPLPLPTSPEFTSLQHDDAVTLFVTRAHARDAGVTLTEENAGIVAEIVTALQGMPLAIELAAARAAMFSLNTLLHRLDQQLPILSGGARDGPDRHITMRQTISWSYDLLTSGEQQVFRALSIFPDGCTLETAITLLSSSGGLSEADIVDAMESLIDSSLLRPRTGIDGATRYRMLITVQEYGHEQLRDVGEDAAIGMAAYSCWSRPLVQAVEFMGKQEVPAEVTRTVTAEYQNLRHHISWLVENGLVEEALEISGSIAMYRQSRGYTDEGRKELEFLLSFPQNQKPTLARVRGLVNMGVIANGQADALVSHGILEEGARLSHEIGALPYEVVAHHVFGRANLVLGHLDEAQKSFDRCYKVALESGIKLLIAYAHQGLATMATWQENFDLAIGHLQKALALSHESGFVFGCAQVKFHLGVIFTFTGRLDESEDLIRQADALFSELDIPKDIPIVNKALGMIEQKRGNLATAERFFRKYLEQSRKIGDMREVASSHTFLATISIEQREFLQAESHLYDAIEFYLRCGDVPHAVRMIKWLAPIHFANNNPWRASWCIAVVDTYLAAGGYSPEALLEGQEQLIKAQLTLETGDEEEWKRLHDMAMAMSPDDMLAEVQTWRVPIIERQV